MEGVVDGFFGAGGEGVVGFDGGVEDDGQVDGAVAEVLEPDVDREGRVHDVAADLVLGHQRLEGLQDDLAGLFEVGAVADGDEDLDELVVAAGVQVAELLREQVGVGEGDQGAVLILDLRGLVAHALDDAADAVAGDLVADADAAGHQLDAVEEVVDKVFQRKTDTGGETGRDVGNGLHRQVQDGESDDQVQCPAQQGEDGVGQAQVHVRFPDGQEGLAVLVDCVA